MTLYHIVRPVSGHNIPHHSRRSGLARPGDFVVADDPDAPGELAAAAALEVCCDEALLW